MFFINEELDEDSVKHVESVEGPAVNIENGAFAWELNPEKPVVDELVLPLFYSRIFTSHYFSNNGDDVSHGNDSTSEFYEYIDRSKLTVVMILIT